MSSIQKIEITTRTFLNALAIFIATVVAYKLRYIFIQLFVALVIMGALNPLVDKVQQWKIGQYKINRPTAVILIYLFSILTIAVFVTLVAQPLASQTAKLVSELPNFASALGATYQVDTNLLTQLFSQLGGISNNLFGILSGFFSNVLNVFTTAVISFYLLLERKNLQTYLTFLLGNRQLEARIERLIKNIELEMGGWVRAQLLLMLIVGVLSYAGFLLLGIPFAVPLAIIAGFLELIPNIGPAIAAVPAIISGFSMGVWYGVGALSWSIFVQQLENHVIVPQIMAKNTGVKPVVTILSLVIGLTLGGIPGAILAVPCLLIGRAIIQEFYPHESSPN